MARVVEGELAQMRNRYRYDLGLQEYLKRIEGKTAQLFMVSCYMGATLGQMDDALRAKKIGQQIGMAFQILDDILDYVSQRLLEIETEPLYTEEEMWSEEYQPVKLEEEEITIEKEKDAYVLSGVRLEKLLYSVNFDDMESIRYFQKIMENNGVFDRLRKMGIQDGDLVKMYDLEFEFYE